MFADHAAAQSAASATSSVSARRTASTDTVKTPLGAPASCVGAEPLTVAASRDTFMEASGAEGRMPKRRTLTAVALP